jgi:hypothetical protein
MAHFARIENDIVREVIVISNADCGGGTFPHSESIGQAFIKGLALDGIYLQTSYSGSFRACYAGSGYSYDPVLDVFVAPTMSEPTP